MIWYNVSIHLDPEIESDWVKWMQEVHLPAMMATGCFERFHFSRLIDPPADDHVIYVAQYLAYDLQALENYYSKFSEDLRTDAINRWQNQFLVFRTVAQGL